MRASPPPPAGDGRARGLTVLREGVAVLHEVDLDLVAGRVTVLTGVNGAGKSTLLEALAGVLPLAAGATGLHGRRVALVPQRVATTERLPLTVRDAVAIGAWARPATRRARRAAVQEALLRTGTAALADRAFHRLSGGQRQRTLLAQALASGADVLLLDEPTGGLDAEQRGRVLAVLAEEARRGVAVLAATHEPELIAGADEVLHLRDGRLHVTRRSSCCRSASGDDERPAPQDRPLTPFGTPPGT